MSKYLGLIQTLQGPPVHAMLLHMYIVLRSQAQENKELCMI